MVRSLQNETPSYPRCLHGPRGLHCCIDRRRRRRHLERCARHQHAARALEESFVANGEWKPAAEPTFDANPTLSMAHKGSIQGSCGVRTEVGFFLYDLAGPTLSVTLVGHARHPRRVRRRAPGVRPRGRSRGHRPLRQAVRPSVHRPVRALISARTCSRARALPGRGHGCAGSRR